MILSRKRDRILCNSSTFYAAMIKQVGVVLAVLAAYGAREMLRRHWMYTVPQYADFDKPVRFKEMQVPVIYYEPGKLGEKLTAVSKI